MHYPSLQEETVKNLYPFQKQILEGDGVNLKKYYKHMKKVRWLRSEHNAKEKARANYLQLAEVFHTVNSIEFKTKANANRDKKQLAKYRYLRRVYHRALLRDKDRKISYVLNNCVI